MKSYIAPTVILTSLIAAFFLPKPDCTITAAVSGFALGILFMSKMGSTSVNPDDDEM